MREDSLHVVGVPLLKRFGEQRKTRSSSILVRRPAGLKRAESMSLCRRANIFLRSTGRPSWRHPDTRQSILLQNS